MTFTDFYKYSWFSNMAYVLWDEGNTTDPAATIIAANDQKRIPNDPASTLLQLGTEIFINQGWTIPSFYPNDAVGFAANLFVNANTNEKVLAIRGTEFDSTAYPLEIGEQTYLDLLDADITEIGSTGLAIRQAVSLFNYIQRLRGDEGADVLQIELQEQTDPPPEGVHYFTHAVQVGEDPFSGPEYVTYYYWFDTQASAEGLGLLSEGDQATVTGHSLGGHLAAVAAVLFPGLFDQAVTFNAAGFDPITSSSLTDEFIQLFSQLPGMETALGFADPALHIHTLESEDSAPGNDTSVVASVVTGQSASTETLIRTENNSHSMDQFMDALGVLSLIEALNPDLPPAEIDNLYDAIFNISGETEERFLQSLSKLMLNNDTPLETVEAGLISHGDFALRSAIHTRILEIQQVVSDTPGLTLQPIDATASAIQLAAQSSLAYRYALVHLNPFVISGNDALYATHNANGELALDNFSEEYLTDRSRMLALKIRLGQADAETETPSADGNRDYLDLQDNETPLELSSRRGFLDPAPVSRIVFGSDRSDGRIDGGAGADRLYGGAGIETLYGEDGADYLEGNGDADVLVGGAGADVLAGGAGDDVLVGGLWDAEGPDHADDTALDTLQGGAGNDAYHVGHRDSIDDSDPVNQTALLDFNGVDARGSYTRLVEGVYKQEATGLILTLSGTAARIRRIEGATVTYFTIENFLDAGGQHTAGAYGITLDEPTVPAPTSTYTNPDEAGGFTVADYFLLEGTTPVAGPFTEVVGNATGETLWIDRSPGLQVATGAGDDTVWVDDDDMPYTTHPTYTPTPGGPGTYATGITVDGGAGNDRLYGGLDADTLMGGAGNDLLFSWDGDDRMDGGSGDDTLGSTDYFYGKNQTTGTHYAVTAVDSYSGGGGQDFITDDWGDDVLAGGDDADFLAGGSGGDVLSGEAGDDVIWGDEKFSGTHGSRSWSISFDSKGRPSGWSGASMSYLGLGLAPGDDLIDGGSGRDFIMAGDGNDSVFCGTENDTVNGQEGNDTIDGQAGNDLLVGERGDDRLFGGDGDDEIEGNNGADEIHGGAGVDTLRGYDYQISNTGVDGDDRIFGEEGNDTLMGMDGDDLLDGGSGADMLYGGANNDTLLGGGGNDTLYGEAGDDILNGGGGVDILNGGAGDDVYQIDGEAGQLSITDTQGADKLLVATGLDLSDVNINRIGDKVTFHVGNGQINIASWSASSVKTLELNDGVTTTALTGADLEAVINDKPVLIAAIPDLATDEDALFTLDLDAYIADPDPGDVLNFNFTYTGMNQLPTWLSFDPATHTLSGTPLNEDVGNFNLQVTATDSGGLTVADSFAITVQNTNDAPIAVMDVSELFVIAGGHYLSGPQTIWVENPEGYNLQIDKTEAGAFSIELGYSMFYSPVDEYGYPLFDPSYRYELVQRYDATGNVNGDAKVELRSSLLRDGRRLYVFTDFDTNEGRIHDVNDVPVTDWFNLYEDDYYLHTSETRMPNAENLANGDIVIAWIDRNTDLVYGQRFDSEGNKINPEFQVSPDESSSEYENANVVALDNGGFAVIADRDSDAIVMQYFNPDGSKNGGEVILAQANGDQEMNIIGQSFAAYDITYLASGGFIVNWSMDDIYETPENGGDLVSHQYVQRFDGSGISIGGPTEFAQDDPIYKTRRIAQLSNGDFATTLIEEEITGESHGLVEIFDSNWVVKSGKTLFTDDEYVSINPDIVGLADGGFMVIWNGINEAYLSRRFFDNGAEFSLVVDVLANDEDMDSEDGPTNFVLTNVSVQDDVGSAAIVDNKVVFCPGADYSAIASGQISEITLYYTMSDAAGAISESSVVITVVSKKSEGGVDVITVDNTNPVVMAGDGNDIINVTGGSQPIVVYAGAGDDTINISGGSEITIYGGSGNDTININLDPTNGGISTPGFIIKLIGESGSDTYVIYGSTSGMINISDLSSDGNENTLIFDPSTTLTEPVLGLGSLALSFGGSGIVTHLENFNPDDVLSGLRDIDVFKFADGTTLSYAQLVAQGFDIEGTTDADLLTGTNVVDRISGSAGNDTLRSGDGDDLLTGGTGDDVLEGGAGDDVYIFNWGDGRDSIMETDGHDELRFGANIQTSYLWVAKQADDLVIDLLEPGGVPYNRLTVRDWFTGEARRIEEFVFGAQRLSGADIEALMYRNSMPVLTNPLSDQSLVDGVAFSLTIPAGTFSDADYGDSISYQATLANGNPLPEWLSFDGASATFSGTPGFADYGTYALRLTATDRASLTASDEFTLHVTVPGAQIGTAGNDKFYPSASFLYMTALGLDGNDTLLSAYGNSRLAGGSGNDTLMGGRGNDFLDGGSGDDSLLGGNPNDPFGQDELRGGAGNDYLAGGMGDDLYVFAGGFGIDRIDDWMGNDRMTLNHIVHEDLWFWREGNALKVGVLNTPDRITIDNWFSNPGRRIETMQTLDDGFVLLENQVQQLVNAMAVFDVPASGNLTPSQADIEAVHGVIAAAWQAA
ncbi:MAG: hypothetical protein EPO31_01285 [Gammaproteobacteria bacterium]|nr:MAG: hypothetical protein EPO31_01285 [Gammaproteobacteria bacterium]